MINHDFLKKLFYYNKSLEDYLSIKKNEIIKKQKQDLILYNDNLNAHFFDYMINKSKFKSGSQK
jgi:hypothetical protein